MRRFFMTKLEKCSLTTLTKRMQEIANMFFTSKKFADITPKLYDIETDTSQNQYTLFVKRVEDTYATLDPLEQLFINNDFFYQNYPYWWMEVYNKKTYLSFKKKAIIHFLRSFFNEV